MNETVIEHAKLLAEKYIEADRNNSEEEAIQLLGAYKKFTEEQKKVFIASFVFPDDKKFLEMYKQFGHDANKMSQSFNCSISTVTSKILILNKIAFKKRSLQNREESDEKIIQVIDVPVKVATPEYLGEKSIEMADAMVRTINEQKVLIDGYKKISSDKDAAIRNLEANKSELLEENIALGSQVEKLREENQTLNALIEELKEKLSNEEKRTYNLEEIVNRIYNMFKNNLETLKEAGLDTDPKMRPR